MIVKIYAVFDAKAACFGQPIFGQNEGTVVRDFSDAVLDGSNKNNMWHRHPEDYSLFHIGDFDSLSGELLPTIPKSILTASAVQQMAPSENGDQLSLNIK